MKTLILAALLAIIPLVAQETTNTPLFNVLVIVLTDVNQLPMVLKAITNAIPPSSSAVVIRKTNPKIAQLETQIRLMEARFTENYKGVPDTYIGDGSDQSQTTLDKMIMIWKQKEVDQADINKIKAELVELKKK